MRATRALPIVCATTILGVTAPLAREITPPPPPLAKPLPKPLVPRWIGYAVSTTGRVFTQPSAEEDRARVFARHECERAAEVSCTAIAVPKSWSVSAVVCGRTAYIAGVPSGSALPLARRKALVAGARGICRVVYPR